MASVGTIKYKSGSNWIDLLHPVGSFHISTSSTSPANLFGGTWSQITGAVLRAGTSTGFVGSDTHTLTISEMPSHAHNDLSRISWSDNLNNGVYTQYQASTANLQTDRTVLTSSVGGGQHTLSCSALTTATSGTGQRSSKSGDGLCVICHKSKSRTEVSGKRYARSLSDTSICPQKILARQVSTEALGHSLQTKGSCGQWAVTKTQAVAQKRSLIGTGLRSAKKTDYQDCLLPLSLGGLMERLTPYERRRTSRTPSSPKICSRVVNLTPMPQRHRPTTRQSQSCRLGGSVSAGLERRSCRVGGR